jgi:hypothetical protein
MGDEEEEDGAALSPDVVPQLPDPAKYPAPGILPRVIRTLVERRREVKKLLKTEKDPVTAKQLDIRQAWGAKLFLGLFVLFLSPFPHTSREVQGVPKSKTGLGRKKGVRGLGFTWAMVVSALFT